MASTVDRRSPASHIFQYQPRTKYNIITDKTKSVQDRTRPNTFTLKKQIWVLNNQSKVPKFIKVQLLRQLGINTFLVLVLCRQKVFHRYQIRFDNTFESELTKFNSSSIQSVTPSNTEKDVTNDHLSYPRRSNRLRRAPFWLKDYHT